MNSSNIPFVFLLLIALLASPFSFSLPDSITQGSSLSVEKPRDILTSSNGIFSAGFYPLGGDNAFYFAIWFNKPSTAVWYANRDFPVNGKKSKLSLLKNGNLVLRDADGLIVWSTDTSSTAYVQLKLCDSGNLVLQETGGTTLWQSFNFPTDTLLPLQSLTRTTQLVSSRSQSNFSTGFYSLLFDHENLLRLLYDGPDVSSIYWFAPWLISWKAGRSTFYSRTNAVLDEIGKFISSDNLNFKAADYGTITQRRLTLDFDGNLRLYCLNEGKWVVSWQAISNPCTIHGSCGENSVCHHVKTLGRKCSCLPGFTMLNESDWSYGCKPTFITPKSNDKTEFFMMKNTEFYGYDHGYFENYTLEMCKKACFAGQHKCKGIQYAYIQEECIWKCYPKARFLNGHHSVDFTGDTYVKIPKSSLHLLFAKSAKLGCSGIVNVTLNRRYEKQKENTSVRYLLYFVCALGGVEAFVIILLWIFLRDNEPPPGFAVLDTTGFRRYTYRELKKATKNFSNEIGRGAGGIVYKGILPDNRVAAIKRLYESGQEEVSDLVAEISTIGNLNHMNLIEMWGYCAERNQKLLVYEYLEHGSIAANLISNSLDYVELANSVGETEQRRLVTWVKEKMSEGMIMESMIEEIIDPRLEGLYDASQMAIMVSVALQCVEEDRNERPTMSQVVEMLLRHSN
ncbi:hypothetical protein ACFE04_005397 [Oxalis oulophora]